MAPNNYLGRGGGGGTDTEQMSLMHSTPLLEPQQSLVVVHFSYSCEQPAPMDPHTSAPASPWRQYPPQHMSPVSHVAPSAKHGFTTQ